MLAEIFIQISLLPSLLLGVIFPTNRHPATQSHYNYRPWCDRGGDRPMPLVEPTLL